MKKIFLSVIIVLITFNTVIAQTKQQNEIFFKEQMVLLDSIRLLPDDVKQNLESKYWKALNQDVTCGMNKLAFHMAMSKVLEDSIYYQQYFVNDIVDKSLTIYQDDCNYYRQKRNFAENTVKQIRPILRQRSQELAFCEVRYCGLPQQRYTEKERIKAKYKSELSKISMKKESQGAPYNLRLVLSNRDKLKLTKIQVDSLIAAAQYVQHLEEKGIITKERANRWEYERKCIMKILNEEQVGNFVILRNSKYAFNRAQAVWQEMQEYNIAFGYDNVQVMKEVYNYILNKEKIKYIYKDDMAKLQEMEDFLYKNSYPQAMKHLRAEKRKIKDSETLDKNTLIF